MAPSFPRLSSVCQEKPDKIITVITSSVREQGGKILAGCAVKHTINWGDDRYKRQSWNQPINLPRVQNVLDSLGRSNYFSLIDIKDAFHQLSVKEGHIKYLGIVTPFGHYTYQIAPMGNSPTYWQRFTEAVLQDVLGLNMAAYIDDINIHGLITLEHFHLVDKVLRLLERYNLKCNPKKCKFEYKAASGKFCCHAEDRKKVQNYTFRKSFTSNKLITRI